MGTTKSPVKIFANIFISFIGAGVLGLPYAFKEAGIIEGVVIMTAVGIISVKAMLLIVDCKYMLTQKTSATNGHKSPGKGTKEEKENLINETEQNGNIPAIKVLQIDDPANPAAPAQKDLNYGDVGYYAIGNAGRFLVEGSILISQIGFCCAYLIFISENLSDYIPGLNLVHWLLILLPPLGVLCLLRHLSSLAISSLFAQISNLMAFAVVFWFDFEHFSQVEIHPKKISIEGFPFFLAVSIYCYEGAGMILSLESSLAESVRSQFRRYFVFTLVLVTMLYISFGACGYLSFGPHTNAIITLNLPKGASLDFAIVVKSCLCLALFFTYPVMMFPVINILEKKILSDPSRVWPGNFLRFAMVALTGLIVLAIPSFSNLMALVGATCCTMLAFTLPGLFHIQLARKYKGSISRGEYCFDIFLIVLGVIGAVIGTWDALVRLKSTHTEIIKSGLATVPPFQPHTNLTLLSNNTLSTNLTNVAAQVGQLFTTTIAKPNGTV